MGHGTAGRAGRQRGPRGGWERATRQDAKGSPSEAETSMAQPDPKPGQKKETKGREKTLPVFGAPWRSGGRPCRRAQLCDRVMPPPAPPQLNIKPWLGRGRREARNGGRLSRSSLGLS